MDIIFGGRNTKKIIIVVVVAILFLLVFPIFSKIEENSTSAQVVTDYGYKGVPSTEGGNNYVSIDNLETQDDVKDFLTSSGLWNSTIEISNEAQLQWYRRLTAELEKTYIDGVASDENPSIGGQYVGYTDCLRDYASDYSHDECNYNGSVTNKPGLKRGSYNKSCDVGKIYNINTVYPTYYYSNESKHIVGGKILGKYPDVLVTASLANTYSLLDQNNVEGEEIQGQISSIQDAISSGKLSWNAVSGLLSNLFEKLAGWYAIFDNVASADAALNDVFDEGSLYTTFLFMADSTCKVTDVARYTKYTGDLGTVINEDNETVPYYCSTSNSFYTECKEESYTCEITNPDTGKKENGTCTHTVASTSKGTDGLPDTYYQHIDGSTKSCKYIKGETNYKLSIDWVCLPTSESPVKCNVIEEKDDMGNILYYKCSGIDSNQVRSLIVDPVFDAYERNELSSNGYLTEESAKKYVYSMDEEEQKNEATGTNPKGYKISNEVREIVTNHIVMEILGGIEGREAALADKDGNFYLQSYNRVLNEEQYKDALNNTIFVKDNILRKEGKPVDEDKAVSGAYSEKLYGVFYSEYNSSFDKWTEEQIKVQKMKDESTKKSQIMEIFYTYEYVSYYLKAYYYENSSGGTSGTGLAQADPTGYRIRKESPTSKSGYYSYGKFGECAWYATGRIKEILATAGSDYDKTLSTNGGDFCFLDAAKDFIIGYDYTQPKVGSVISWSGGKHLSGCSSRGCGHVAIIEKVYYNSTGRPIYVDMSEGGLGFSGYSHSDLDNGVITRQKACGTGKCFNYRKKVSVEFLKNYGGKNYNFECYIYLLKDNTCSADSKYTVDDNILKYITNEFNSDDGMQAKINYYNFLTGTEGGDKISSNFTKEYLAEPVKLIGNIEGTNYASVDPGLYIGTWNTTLSIKINSKKYDFKLSSGCTVPRWVALYKFLEVYKSNRKKTLNLISSNGLSDKINSTTQVHAMMRLIWTYGEGGATNKINQLLSAYKSGGEHDVWCKLSSYVLATDNGVVKTFGNYFNMNEMIFELFTTGNYVGNRNYKGYKYYTSGRVNTLLNNGYPKYATSYLENALQNGEFPQSNSYSDCDGD